MLVKRGMTPIQAIRAATVVGADLIEPPTSAASPPRCSPTSSASPATRSTDITTTRQVPFVMKDGKVHKHTRAAA